MTRTGEDAIKWGFANAHTGQWYRLCLMFVRECFDQPGGIPNAGVAWDTAEIRHEVSSGRDIPRAVPVYWETADVADHIALSLGGGKCLSTDVLTRGDADVVGIDELTAKWGMQLHGWSEDMSGARIWGSPPPPPAHPTPHITAALQADNRADRVAALQAVVKHGSPEAAKQANLWLELIDHKLALATKTGKRRAALKALQVK